MDVLSEYCRHQSERLLALAQGCRDPVLRKQLTAMASDWVVQAKTERPLMKQRKTNSGSNMHSHANEAPEIEEALAKAEECAKKAALAETAKDRDHYDRMRRKWLGIADGWRFIVEIHTAGPNPVKRA